MLDRSQPFRPVVFVLAAALFVGAMLHAAAVGAQTLPPVPVPAENPVTESKRVLGKILFWDEQLSSDMSVACGTCHIPEAAGAEPLPALHPGADGVFGNADDVLGSFGVARLDETGQPVTDPVFGLDRQVTPRATPNFFGGLWAPQSFWDGRADEVFLNPEDGSVLIASGGALENQALGPFLSDVEMAKEGRTLDDLVERIESVFPLARASSLPTDVTDALAVDPTYADLFTAAFGDSAVTPARIAFAIATYERTLVADQTPWDLFMDGDATALTGAALDGWLFFQGSTCSTCHTPPLFADLIFRNVGVRDPAEDAGRFDVTAFPDDLGRFKTASLRNVGLKTSYFHTGELETLAEVVSFYQPGNQGSSINVDPGVPALVPPPLVPAVIAFLEEGLEDPRVAAGTFPFDRPILAPEPGSASMLALGVAALSGWARRRRSTAARRSPRRGTRRACRRGRGSRRS